MIALIQFAARHAILVILLIAGVTLLALTQIPDLRIEVSAQGLIAADDPAREQYQRVLDDFGSSDSIAIIIRDDALFSARVLEQVNEVSIRLSQLDFVSGIDSLFTIDDVRNEDDNILFVPFLDKIPQTTEAANKIKQAALANPFIAKSLLSLDGKTMAINVRLLAESERVQSDEEIVEKVEAAIAPLKKNADKVFAIGLPYVLAGLSELIVTDLETMLPLSMAALLLVLLLMLHRASAVVLPFMTAVISVIWTLAFMAMLGIPLNVMTSIVPALIVIIGSTEDIHLLAGWYRARDMGETKLKAIDFMASSTGLAVLLTFVTTYLGFLSIVLNDIQLLQQFAIVASTGLLFNFIITTFMIPAFLAGFCRHGCKKSEKTGNDRYADFAHVIFNWVGKRNVLIIVLTSLLTLAGIYGATSIKVDNDNMSYFNKDAPIHFKANFLHEHLAGMQSLDIILESHIDNTFAHVKYLQEVLKLQDFLDKTGYFDKTTSFANYITLMNRVMEGLDLDEMELPEDDALIREYLLFIDHDDVSQFVDKKYRTVRIPVRHNISSSSELKKAIAEIRNYADTELDKGLNMQITGESMLSNEAADRMVTGQMLSLLFMLGVIILVVSVLFLDVKAGLLAAIPNIFPVILLFGVMGYFDVPLNTGTIMIAAIAIGICVDDTMHFLVSYNQEMRHFDSTEQGILAAMQHEARPIMSTSLALALGFGVLAFSNFPPVVHFGLLSAMVILLAVIANFILMPVLLCKVRLVTIWDVLGVKLQSQLIDGCDLFNDLRPFEIRKLIAMSHRQVYKAGETIVAHGDAPKEMFVILSGQVDVYMPDEAGSGERKHIQSLGVGAVFGEVGMIGNIQRIADVVAHDQAELLSFEMLSLKRLNRFLPRTAAKLYFNISGILARRMASKWEAPVSNEVFFVDKPEGGS